jgi:hypothetical protein
MLGRLLPARLVAGLVLLLALRSALGDVIDCSAGENAALTRQTTCGPACRSDTYVAISSLFDVYKVNVSHVGRRDRDMPWDPSTACRVCVIADDVSIVGSQSYFGAASTPNSYRLPSYCCWPGVVCCTEAIRNNAMISSSCQNYTVSGLGWDHYNMTGTIMDGLPYLQVRARAASARERAASARLPPPAAAPLPHGLLSSLPVGVRRACSRLGVPWLPLAGALPGRPRSRAPAPPPPPPLPTCCRP